MKHQEMPVLSLESELESAQRRIQVLESELDAQSRSTRAIVEADRFRKAVIDNAAEGICVCHNIPTDPYTEFTVWNPCMTELTGYTLEEINRLGWYQTVYPDPEVRKQAQERMNRMRQGEDLRSERWEITRVDGEKRLVSVSTSVLVAADGMVHVLALIHDVTLEQDLARERLLARTDALTGVKNLRAFKEDAIALFRLASRHKLPVAIGYLDLDDFKVVNDTQGHDEGNRLLQAVGTTLARTVRSTDLVGRLGGDEFCIAVIGVDAVGARIFFDRLRDELLDEVRTRNWPIGISIGVVVIPNAQSTVEEALAHADTLLYQAKKAGKNRVVHESQSRV